MEKSNSSDSDTNLTLRNYELNTPQYFFYKEQHEEQDLNFVKNMKEKYI